MNEKELLSQNSRLASSACKLNKIEITRLEQSSRDLALTEVIQSFNKDRKWFDDSLDNEAVDKNLRIVWEGLFFSNSLY